MWSRVVGALLMVGSVWGQVTLPYNEDPIAADIGISFAHEGWSDCKSGYAITALYKSSCNGIYCIEHFRCARPKGSTGYKRCVDHSVWHSFDHAGTFTCPRNMFLTGLYRSGCNNLYCIEKFRCCEFSHTELTTTGCDGWWVYPKDTNLWSVPAPMYLIGLHRGKSDDLQGIEEGGFRCLQHYPTPIPTPIPTPVPTPAPTPSPAHIKAKAYVETYSCNSTHKWVVDHPEVPLATITKYLMVVFVGPMIIPVGGGVRASLLNPVLALWNLLLGVLSTAGAFVCVGYLMDKVSKHSLEVLVCSDSDKVMWELPEGPCNGSVGFFMTAFMFSKFLELCDTLPLLAKGEPVTALHWYRHAADLAYSWFVYASGAPAIVLLGAMNYCVHSVMCTYFAVSQFTCVFSFLNPFINFIELGQIILGFAINLYAYRLSATRPCSKAFTNTCLTACFVLYPIYGILFCRNYFSAGSKKAKAS